MKRIKDESGHRYFLDVDLRSLDPEEREKLNKRFIIAKAYHHLGEFVHLLLDASGKNSIELGRFRVYINQALSELERNGICYVKVMPNRRVRIFKTRYCCSTVENWKKCPEYRCPIWPYCRDSECPHDQYKDKVLPALENAEEVKYAATFDS